MTVDHLYACQTVGRKLLDVAVDVTLAIATAVGVVAVVGDGSGGIDRGIGMDCVICVVNVHHIKGSVPCRGGNEHLGGQLV